MKPPPAASTSPVLAHQPGPRQLRQRRERHPVRRRRPIRHRQRRQQHTQRRQRHRRRQQLTGLAGNDTYTVGAGDTIVETATGGIDTVQSSLISLDLANYANVENITLLGAAALSATGNAAANTLNGASDTAANILTGLDGNDTYVVGAGDTIVETATGSTDTVKSSLISLDLANYANVENITLLGATALSATGNAGNDTLIGASDTAANILTGLDGNDTYTVGAGDTIVETATGGNDTVQSWLHQPQSGQLRQRRERHPARRRRPLRHRQRRQQQPPERRHRHSRQQSHRPRRQRHLPRRRRRHDGRGRWRRHRPALATVNYTLAAPAYRSSSSAPMPAPQV